MIILRLCILSLALTVFACGSTTPALSKLDLKVYLKDEAFPDYDKIEVPTVEEIFSLNQEIEQWVNRHTRLQNSQEEQIKALAKAVFERSELNILYKASANTNAIDTFKNRAANCLSLTIMTFAMAQHAGFDAQFQQVNIPEYWTRRGAYALLNGHINLLIRPGRMGDKVNVFQKDVVLDFDPQDGINQFSTKRLELADIVAMFYNNLGVDAFLRDDHVAAYANFRAALMMQPSFDGAWVNLGLLYRNQALYEASELAYQQAIELNDNNLTAWENLAYLYRQTGNAEWAADIASKLEQRRENNPFYHMMLAQQSEAQGQLDGSIEHYKNAIRLDNRQHEFYFGMAQIYLQKGDKAAAQRYLKLAKKKAKNSNMYDTYDSKLSLLSRVDLFNP